MSTIFISVGEPSGDLYAGRLVDELVRLNPSVKFVGIGGKELEGRNVELFHSIEELSIVGFQEVIGGLKRIREIIRDTVKRLGGVELAILVDCPGFHLRLARYLKYMGVPVVYYIIPQIWAWGTWRAKLMKRYVDKALVIFPFEEKILKNYGIDTEYVGHPLMDYWRENSPPEIPEYRYTIGMLPGSRRDEVRRLFPKMLSIKRELEKRIEGIGFIVSLRHKPRGNFSSESNLHIYEGPVADIIRASDFVIVASGTASLEVGLYGRPMVVLYMLSDISWLLARSFVKIPHVSLVNILLGKKVVPEYIQHIHPEEVADDIISILENSERYELCRGELRKLSSILKSSKRASEQAARICLSLLETKN